MYAVVVIAELNGEVCARDAYQFETREEAEKMRSVIWNNTVDEIRKELNNDKRISNIVENKDFGPTFSYDYETNGVKYKNQEYIGTDIVELKKV